jgi:hypothetical protein
VTAEKKKTHVVTVTSYDAPSAPRIHIHLSPSPERDQRRHTAKSNMSSPYELRTNDNGKSKKQSMAELKLRRLTELNQRLQEDLNRRRIPVSEAAMEYV